MLHLQDLAKQNQLSQTLTITKRIPDFITAPCVIHAQYRVEAREDFYLIHLNSSGLITVVCQRCMNEFVHEYNNQTVIAVCRNDERAAELLEQYECIVSSNWQVELEDLICDELYLYVSRFHPDIDDCDSQINQILNEKFETY